MQQIELFPLTLLLILSLILSFYFFLYKREVEKAQRQVHLMIPFLAKQIMVMATYAGIILSVITGGIIVKTILSSF